MKKVPDDVSDLFRIRLSQAEMEVRDGFWEEIVSDLSSPVSLPWYRRLLLFKLAAAASVLLVMAGASALFYYLSSSDGVGGELPDLLIKQAPPLIQDGIMPHTLPQLPLPAVASLLSLPDLEETIAIHDSSTVLIDVSYVWEESSLEPCDITASPSVSPLSTVETISYPEKKPRGSFKFQVGTALPAADGFYKMPFTVGVGLEKRLTNRLSCETGLLYTYLSSCLHRLHYVGIPLKLNVTLFDTPKSSIYASVGGMMDKCIAGVSDVGFGNAPLQWAVTAAIGVNYQLSDRLEVFAEPGISHYFKNDSSLPTLRKERATNFNLFCGIRMTY